MAIATRPARATLSPRRPIPDALMSAPARPAIPADAPECWVKDWNAWVSTAKALGVDPYAPTKAPHRATVFGAGAAAFFYSIGGKGWLAVARRIKRAAT